MVETWDESSVLVAVFERESSARRAAEEVTRATHEPNRVRIGRRADEIASVKAEMQAEMDDSWTSPQAATAYPKEAAKGLALLLPACCIVGGVLVAPLGFIPVGDVPAWARVLLAAFVGVLMGGTVALVAAPALAANRPDDQLAGEQGVVLRVEGMRSDVVDALVAAEPLRLDRLRASDLTRLETISAQDRSDAPTIVADMLDRSTDPNADADIQSGSTTNRTTGAPDEDR